MDREVLSQPIRLVGPLKASLISALDIHQTQRVEHDSEGAIPSGRDALDQRPLLMRHLHATGIVAGADPQAAQRAQAEDLEVDVAQLSGDLDRLLTGLRSLRPGNRLDLSRVSLPRVEVGTHREQPTPIVLAWCRL